ncbi:MAG: permease-like cell division protein FtsX, partial [Flavobacteriales bacterium]
MAEKIEKYQRRRAITSSITTVFTISLVLFMLGVIGLIVLNAKKISEYYKENIKVQVFLNEDAKKVDITRVKKSINSKSYVKRSEFVSKKEAAEIMEKQMEEDFMDFVGHNPLSASFDINLKANYANPDSLKIIRRQIDVPVIVDAGIGSAADAAQAMELGADAILTSSAIAGAEHPGEMASALKKAV